MEKETGRGAQTMELAEMDTLLGQRNCGADSCGGAALTTLDHQALCLNHFLARCYEALERIEPRGRDFNPGPVAAMRACIEECSRKALDIALRCQGLSNLQRAQLLDVLLWAGELYLALRVPRHTHAPSIAFYEGHAAARTVSRYYRAWRAGGSPLTR